MRVDRRRQKSRVNASQRKKRTRRGRTGGRAKSWRKKKSRPETGQKKNKYSKGSKIK